MEIQIASHYILWYIIITLLGVVVGIISYRTSFPPLGKYQRIFLATLRSLMIILLGVFLIEPLINLYSNLTIKPQLAYLQCLPIRIMNFKKRHYL